MSIQSWFPLGLIDLISDHFRVFIKFVTILLLFYVLVFGHEACGILASWPGVKLTPPASEGKVLTTGQPGKSLKFAFLSITVMDQTSVSLQTSPDVALTLHVMVLGGEAFGKWLDLDAVTRWTPSIMEASYKKGKRYQSSLNHMRPLKEDILIFGFIASRSVRIKCLLLKPPSLWCLL